MAGGRVSAESQQLRSDLLRSTYRIDSDAHPAIATASARAARALRLAVPISLYQAEGDVASNAALIFVPNEAIVLFSGPLTDMLDDLELTAVLGHELAHHLLWTADNGDHLVADRLIHAMMNDDGSSTIAETARRLSLTTELFADRGALLACDDLHSSVSALVKITTGMRSVSAVSYLTQAEEVIMSDTRSTTALSHPETFQRAIALRDWLDGVSQLSPAIDQLIYVVDDIDRLDMIGQDSLATLTRTVIEDLLAPEWMQTDAVIGHAREFFSGIKPSPAPSAIIEVPNVASTRKYLAYVLLDFAVVDPDLDRQSLIESSAMANRLGIAEQFAELLERELQLKPKMRAAVLAEGEVRSIELEAGLVDTSPDRARA